MANLLWGSSSINKESEWNALLELAKELADALQGQRKGVGIKVGSQLIHKGVAALWVSKSMHTYARECIMT
jgi:hypothetical protein